MNNLHPLAIKMFHKALFALMMCLSVNFLSAQDQRAVYDISFESNWSQATHPHNSGSIPASAHWSKLVGATHNGQVVFLEHGQIATEGVERIAELGSNGVFFSEVDAAILQGSANQKINGPNLGTALGQMNINDIMVHEDFPYLTLLSMIAPSPDWMIAVNSLSLLDNNGDWIQEIQLDLYPYDAGTDSGPDYVSPNSDMQPPGVISSLQGVAPFSNEKIGTLTITLEGTNVGIDDLDSEKIIIYPNPVTDLLNIEATGFQIRNVLIYNLVGQEIVTQEFQGTLDVSVLEDGVYMLKLYNQEGGAIVRRILKHTK